MKEEVSGQIKGNPTSIHRLSQEMTWGENIHSFKKVFLMVRMLELITLW